MTSKATDLCDEHGDQAWVLQPIFQDLGGRPDFVGPALTVRCFEDNSRIKELSQQPGEGRVLVVDGGGSDRCALLGGIIGEDLVGPAPSSMARSATRRCCRWPSRRWASRRASRSSATKARSAWR